MVEMERKLNVNARNKTKICYECNVKRAARYWSRCSGNLVWLDDFHTNSSILIKKKFAIKWMHGAGPVVKLLHLIYLLCNAITLNCLYKQKAAIGNSISRWKRRNTSMIRRFDMNVVRPGRWFAKETPSCLFTVFNHGQWWSIFITHRPHFRQWCDRGALYPSHTLQYCKNFRTLLSCAHNNTSKTKYTHIITSTYQPRKVCHFPV